MMPVCFPWSLSPSPCSQPLNFSLSLSLSILHKESCQSSLCSKFPMSSTCLSVRLQHLYHTLKVFLQSGLTHLISIKSIHSHKISWTLRCSTSKTWECCHSLHFNFSLYQLGTQPLCSHYILFMSMVYHVVIIMYCSTVTFLQAWTTIS